VYKGCAENVLLASYEAKTRIDAFMHRAPAKCLYVTQTARFGHPSFIKPIHMLLKMHCANLGRCEASLQSMHPAACMVRMVTRSKQHTQTPPLIHFTQRGWQWTRLEPRIPLICLKSRENVPEKFCRLGPKKSRHPPTTPHPPPPRIGPIYIYQSIGSNLRIPDI